MSRKKSKHRKAVREVATAPVVEAAEIELAPDEPSNEVVAEAEPVEAVELAADDPSGKAKKRRGKKVETSDELSADAIEAVDVSADVVEVKAKKLRGKKAETSDELAADATEESNSDEAVDVSADDADGLSVESAAQLVPSEELSANAPSEEIPDELVASADELRAEGDGAGDDSPPVEGDDIVGEQITDEAGVEAALLPGGLSAVQLRHLIEALVFAADKPVTLQRLRQLTRVSDVSRIEAALAELQEDYKERGIALQQVSGGFQFRTNTAFSSWVQQLIAGRPVRLSRAQLETLAIVAYRQPITRPEIDEIRGVDSSATLRLLLERSLIRVLGKREEVGRPTLYGTTKEFLDFFSLSDLRELPTLREYSELTAESRQVMSDRLGVPLDANGELIEPEPSDEIDAELDVPQDNASIVDSILAEHAAAEAEAESRFDASAMADAALSGSDSFSEAMTPDDDSMSLSGEVSAFGGSKLPASEARSYVDAIRASLVSDELEELGEIDDLEISADSESSADETALLSGHEHESAMLADEQTETAHVGHDSDATAEETAMVSGHEPPNADATLADEQTQTVDETAMHSDASSHSEATILAHAQSEASYVGRDSDANGEEAVLLADDSEADANTEEETAMLSAHEHAVLAHDPETAHVGHDSASGSHSDETVHSHEQSAHDSNTDETATVSAHEQPNTDETARLADERIETAHVGHGSASDSHLDETAGHDSNARVIVGREQSNADETALAHESETAHMDPASNNVEIVLAHQSETAHVGQTGEDELHATAVGHDSVPDSVGERDANADETALAHQSETAHMDPASNNVEIVLAHQSETAHVGQTGEDELGATAHVGHSTETGEHRDDAGIADTDAPTESPDSDSDDPEGN